MEPLSAPARSPDRARRVLLAAAVVHVVLFGLESRATFADLLDPQPVTRADRTGPFVTGADCMGYYAWLRSPLIDGDFQFDDEFARTVARVPSAEAFPLTATGHRGNHWPVGPAIVWAPAVVAVHLTLTGLGRHAPWPADGYSPPYQLAVGGTTLALALLALALTYRIGRRFAGPNAAAVAAALVTLGTPVVAYGAVQVSMAHGPATAALTVFAFVWLRTFGSTRPARWAGLGGLLGLTCLMRWQLATFAALPALEALWLAARAKGWPARLGVAARLAAAGLAAAVAFAPHFAAKQVVYGHPLGGLHHAARNWFDPSLWSVLGSTDRSLFYWTPVTLPAVAGLLYGAVRTRRPALAILAAAVAVQVYAVAALVGDFVYLGWSFGFRFLTETCALLAVGAAVLLDRAGPRAARGLALGGGLLVGWNLLLLGAYRYCIGGEHGADPAALLALAERYVVRRPADAIPVLAAAVWLTCNVVAAFGTVRGPAAGAVAAREPDRLAA